MKKFVAFVALLSVALDLFAQPVNDVAFRSLLNEKPVLAWNVPNERDLLWQKSIWQVVDVREKINLPFTYPPKPFFEIITRAALEGELTAYSTETDDFTYPLTATDLDRMLHRYDTVEVWPEDLMSPVPTVVANEIYYEDIKRFRIKEIWYFDSKTSSLNVRILGIAPMMDVYDENGNYKYEKPLFWINYPEARDILAREAVYITGNEAARLTWEDLFEMRMFSCYIYKEGNVRNNRLHDLYSGVHLLLEADKIRQEIFNYEHDLWQY